MTPQVVGVDLSLTATGLAWPDGTVLTHGRAGLTNPRTPPADRGRGMMGLVLELGNLIGRRYDAGRLDGGDPEWPALVLIEGFPPSGGTTRIDPERGYVWWSVVNLLTRHGVPVLPVAPSTLKLYACGRGDANKREVWAGVREHFPQWEIHKTGKNGKVLTSEDHDRADAVALMAMGCELLGEPIVELPARHRKALDVLELPAGVMSHVG